MRDIENLQIKFNCQKKAFINDILNQITYLPCSQYLGFQVQIKEIFLSEGCLECLISHIIYIAIYHKC